ncbi:MAG: hypothetical protein FWF28_01360, partial [Micrococcales bacterium]|nr:hypothetical protein [Micrococcales bacterium]
MDSTGSRGFGGVVHLALHGQGSGDPSGWYTPFGFDLRDGGHDPVLDQLSSIHEIHHAQLTDCTAWGTALHVAFRLGFTSLFDQLLGLCRQIQEMFATVSSVLMLEGEHGDLRQRLAAHYPAYVRFVTSAQALLACVEGPMRAYLMNTQVARVCMQTPILDQMPPATDARIAMPRVIDTPDGRWRWFLHHGQNLVAQASVVADARLRADEAGATALAKDDRIDPSRAVVIEEYDRYWTAWEMAAYSVLADGLAKAGAHVLDFNGHQSQTTRTLEKLALTHSDVGLAAAAPGDTMETAWASAGIVQGRHLVAAAGKWSACWVPDVGEFDWQPMTIAGRPELVIDDRLSSRLADLYEWDEDE